METVSAIRNGSAVTDYGNGYGDTDKRKHNTVNQALFEKE